MARLILIVLVLIPLALLPTIIAVKRNHTYKVPIILVNVLGGLLWGLGWIIALVWCFIDPRKEEKKSSTIAGELEKLHELKEKGALTQEEFDMRKKSLLKADA